MVAVRHIPVFYFTFVVVISSFADEDPNLDSEAVFNQRILPIFRSEKPSSCVQCHLSSVDLKNYILPSSQKTFLSLRDQKLIDLEQPAESKILRLIQMGEQDLDDGAKLIHAKLRQQEYEAFAAWIRKCCENETLRNLPKLSDEELGRPAVANEVIRHSRKSRVVDSFARNVFSQRMRCFPCHTPHEIDVMNPRHAAAINTRKKLQEEYGDQFDRLNLFKKTPEETLNFLIQVSRLPRPNSLPLLNLDDPQHSLIVLKPTSRLPKKKPDGTFEPPSAKPLVTHMGGLKMHPHDQSYKSFIAWIEDYAKTTQGEYQSVDELPADNWNPTQLVLRLTNTPDDWPVGTPVQLYLHQKDEKGQGWQEEPIAFTQGTVTPKKMVNGMLFLFDSKLKENRKQDSLPQGTYHVRICVDLEGRLVSDPTVMLTEKELQGATTLEASRWREGFRNAKIISAESLHR